MDVATEMTYDPGAAASATITARPASLLVERDK